MQCNYKLERMHRIDIKIDELEALEKLIRSPSAITCSMYIIRGGVSYTMLNLKMISTKLCDEAIRALTA